MLLQEVDEGFYALTNAAFSSGKLGCMHTIENARLRRSTGQVPVLVAKRRLLRMDVDDSRRSGKVVSSISVGSGACNMPIGIAIVESPTRCICLSPNGGDLIVNRVLGIASGCLIQQMAPTPATTSLDWAGTPGRFQECQVDWYCMDGWYGTGIMLACDAI